MSETFRRPVYRRPLTLLIKPASSTCDLKCGYCFYRGGQTAPENGRMSDETVTELLKKLAAYSPASVSFVFQGGEPTLAGLGFFRRFVQKTKETLCCPVSFSLQTNGLSLTDDFAVFLRQNGFLVGLSLDGGRVTHDRYRKTAAGESVFDRVLAAAALLKRQGVAFNILSVVDDENAGDLPETWRLFREQDFSYLQFIPCLDEGTGIALSPETYARFLMDCFDLWYADFLSGRAVSVRHIDNYLSVLLGREPENCAFRGVCGGYFVVEANGDLYPCDFYCQPEWKLGSVYDPAPFLPKERLMSFIRASERVHADCRRCRWGFLCRGGCRRDRTEDGARNRYCEAYKAFFEHAYPRLQKIASALAPD